MYLYFVLLLMLLVLFCLRTPVQISESFVSNIKNKNKSCLNHLFLSKYSTNNCVSCENPRKGPEIKISNFDENTYYHVLDNCVQSGQCRVGEDPINMFPTKMHQN